MKYSISFLILLSVINTRSFAQTPDANYALPADATEVINTVNKVPGYSFTLTEGGKVLSDVNSTCDRQINGSFKSTVGFTLQHFDDKVILKQMTDAFAPVGGMKGIFKKSMDEEYNNIENDPNITRLGFVKKGLLIIEQLEGAVVAYYTVTHSCVENANSTATKVIYHVMLLTDRDYLLITNEMYSANADKAKKYAEEIISKTRTLDYSVIK